MSSGVPLNSARRTVTFAADELTVPDGIASSVSGDTEALLLQGEDFDGESISEDGFLLPLPRTITISRSSSVGAYTLDPILVTGKRGGNTITDELTPEDADGDDVLVTPHAFDQLLRIEIPEQESDAGSFDIGVQDISAPHGDTFTGVKLHQEGTVYVQYGEGDGAPTDAIPEAELVLDPIAPTRILTGADQTATGITLYMP